ncbi:MAG: GNAT family N-acetyltransferase [Alphaproteobacteria bacterium]|nr:GNAT family N-acetyltransferase [Alphaproteobacteria bacterium]
MNDNISFEYLADCPEYAQACAAWIYGRWSLQMEGVTLDSVLVNFDKASQKEGIPLAVVAVDNERKVPVACGVLTMQDGGEMWSHHTPWITSVYTHYRYRRQGIAKVILKRLEDEARCLEYKDVYLKSGSAAGFYLIMGYEALETINTKETGAGTMTLLKKKLC